MRFKQFAQKVAPLKKGLAKTPRVAFDIRKDLKPGMKVSYFYPGDNSVVIGVFTRYDWTVSGIQQVWARWRGFSGEGWMPVDQVSLVEGLSSSELF